MIFDVVQLHIVDCLLFGFQKDITYLSPSNSPDRVLLGRFPMVLQQAE